MSAIEALGWICAQGQRNCNRVPWWPCTVAAPDDPHDWCDVCIAGAAYFAALAVRVPDREE